MKRSLILFPFLLALAACGEPERGPGGLTADEERRLDEAARMLDEQAVDTNAILAGEAANEDVPAEEAPAE